MNRRVLYIVLAVLVLVLGAVLIIPRLSGGGSPRPSSARTRRSSETDATKPARAKGRRAKVSEEAAKPAEKVAEPEAQVADTTTVPWGGDPFVRDWLVAGELRDLRLRAVTLGEKPLALINDRVVAQGDTINGKRVATITRDSVVFEFGGQRRGLKIGE